MNYWSVKKSVIVGWALMTIVVVFSLSLMFPLFLLHDIYGCPFYISIPLAFIIPITTLGVGFHNLGKFWIPWIYMRVADVVEFEKARQLSGFIGYPVSGIKNERKRLQIEARFSNYQFVDDYTVPYETTIYFRKPYQNLLFVVMGGGFILSIVPFLCFPEPGPQLAIPIFFGVMMLYQYSKSSSRAPQLSISDEGINVRGSLYKWEEISFYVVLRGKTSYLNFTHNENEREVEIDDLMVSDQHLNHLLHIYSYRNKSHKK